MKKLAVLLALLSSTSTVFAALPNGIDDFQVNVPLYTGNVFFGVTALYLKANAPELQYAVSFDERNAFDNGRLRSIEPQYKFGYNLFLGYGIPCTGNDWLLSYTQFDEKASDHTTAPNGFIASEIFSSTLDVPAEIASLQYGAIVLPAIELVPARTIPVDFTVSQASAGDTMRQTYLDLEFGQSINADNLARVRLFAGLRMAKIRHRLDSTFIYNTTLVEENTVLIPDTDVELTTTITLVGDQLGQIVKESSHFDGLGPRIGFEGTFFLGGGLGIVGKLSGAMLVGHIDSSISQEFAGSPNFTVEDVSVVASVEPPPVIVNGLTLPVGTVLVANDALNQVLISSPDTTRIVPNLEAKIALDYSYQVKCRTVDFELGWYINHYFDAIDRPSFFSIAAENMDADFEGPYFAINVKL